jgi:maltose/maltodextrin transport system substrate-binding protein/arabinogalactan oligomer/maltooligosaccharide transport system substrate-binding protein
MMFKENAKKFAVLLGVACLLLMPVMAQDDEDEAPLLAAEEGTLTIWIDAARVPMMEAVGAAFEAEYDVPVRVQQLGFGDIRDQLKIAGPAGEGPDIVVGAHDWLGELVSNGLLSPLDLGDKAEFFDPVSLQAFTYEGALYGLPFQVEAIALYYNRDLVPEAPATWDELKAIAAALQADGLVDQGYVLQEGDPYHTYPIFSGFGGYVFGRDDEGSYDPDDVGLDSAGGVLAAEELAAMVEAGLLRPDVDYPTMISLFAEGRAAMFITGPWALNDVRNSGINYGVALIPEMAETPRPFVGVQGFMVNRFSPNELLAQIFLNEFIATDEAMLALYEAVPSSPAWLPIIEQVDDPDLPIFAASAANGDPMPAIPQMSAVWESWTVAIRLIFQGGAEADVAIQDAAAVIRDLIASAE